MHVVIRHEFVNITAMLAADPAPVEAVPAALRLSRAGMAAKNARSATEWRRNGMSDEELWRFAILQTLDDYISARKHGGITAAAEVFTPEPEMTGSQRIDSAFAALAEYLARADGWTAPAWTSKPSRCTTEWFPLVIPFDYPEARSEGVPEFRNHGIFVTYRGLSRA